MEDLHYRSPDPLDNQLLVQTDQTNQTIYNAKKELLKECDRLIAIINSEEYKLELKCARLTIAQYVVMMV